MLCKTDPAPFEKADVGKLVSCCRAVLISDPPKFNQKQIEVLGCLRKLVNA